MKDGEEAPITVVGRRGLVHAEAGPAATPRDGAGALARSPERLGHDGALQKSMGRQSQNECNVAGVNTMEEGRTPSS